MPKSTYSIDGKTLSEESAHAEIEQALGVKLAVAGRLSMMLGGGHIAAQADLDLEAHLHHAFGVSHLLEAAETAAVVAKEAEKARAVFRSSSKERLVNRYELEAEIADLEVEARGLESRSSELRRLQESAHQKRTLIERHLAIVEQMERYVQKRSQLMSEVQDVLGRPFAAPDDESVGSDLRHELQRLERTASEATEGVVAARSVIASARLATDLLNQKAAACPTCTRPITAEESDSARSLHGVLMSEARVEQERLEAAQEDGQTRARILANLLTRFESLEPPTVGSGSFDIPSQSEVEALYREASVALDEHNQRLGAVKSRIESLQQKVRSDNQLQQEERELRLVYRREALALAGAQVLRKAANEVIESQIEPIAEEVRWRWKRLFATEGLTFRADGSIVRVHAGEELGWQTLSGGERTWARIVTHLLVLAATTSLPFAWFDEPLEHLDPQLRHTVAASLANATAQGSPRQLLVTTYEHTLARQLAEDTDSANIIAIRQSSDHSTLSA